MKKRVLSLTMAFLLAFPILPAQAAVKEVPEYEKSVEKSTTEEGTLKTESQEAKSLTETATKAASVEETAKTEPAQETATQKEKVEPVTKNTDAQSQEKSGTAVQATDDETEAQEKAVRIGDTEYATFAEAVNAANAATGDVMMTILADIEDTDANTGTFSYSNANAALTIDLNGKTVHVSKFAVESGTVTFRDSNPAEGNYFSRVTGKDNGKIVLESGCLGTGNEEMSISGAFEMHGGSTKGRVVLNGYATINMTAGNMAYIRLGSPRITGKMTGGNFATLTRESQGGTTKYSYAALLGTGYAFKYQNGGWLSYEEMDKNGRLTWYDVTIQKCIHSEYKAGTCQFCNYQCPHTSMTQETDACPDCGMSWMIASQKDGAVTKYASLQEAFDQAENGSMFTLLEAVDDRYTVYTIKNGKTFTLDTKAYAVKVSRIDIKTGCTLTLKGSGEIIGAVWAENTGKLDLPGEWTGTIEDITLRNGTSGLNMENGIVKELYLTTDGSNSNVQISGGTCDRIKNYLSSPIPLNRLLKEGYVFKQNNQTIEYTGEVPGWGTLDNLTVERCEEHRDKNNDNLCDYCNQSATYIVEVTKDGSTAKYSGLQGALNEVQNGATVKLLMDIPARAQNTAYTLDGKQITLDLNNKTISGSGISAVKGANLTITGNGTVDGTVRFDATSQGLLENGRFGGVVSNNPNKTLPELLPEGYAYRESIGETWKSDINGTSIDDVVVLPAPIRALEIENHIGDLTYGYSTTEQLKIIATARMQENYNDNEVTYQWHRVDAKGVESSESVSTNQQFVVPTGLPAGEYTYRVHAAYHGYTATVDVTFEVKKADAKVIEAPKAVNRTYTGEPKFLIEKFGRAEGGTFAYSLEKDGKYDSIPRVKEAGEYTVWYKVIGDDNHNDSEPASVTATISYLTTDARAALADTNKGENGWYTGTVTIQAPAGYTISSALEGPYTESFTTDMNGWNSYYLRQDGSGFITDTKKIQIKIDAQAPAKPSLTITKAATDTTVTLQAAAEDEPSGVKEYTLKEASGKILPQTSSDGVFALTGLDSNEEYNFTVTATDQAGNISESSEICKVMTRKIPFADADVKLKNADKIYNGAAQTPDVEVSVNGTVLAADQYVVSYEQDGAAVAAPTKAGTYTLVVTASENGGYEGTATSRLTYTIAKKTITAELGGTLEKTYDGTADVLESQKLTVLLNGVEDGDEVTAAADAYIYNGANVKDASTITGSGITLAGAEAENYKLAETKVSAKAKILPIDLTTAEVTLGAALIDNGKTQTQEVEKVTLAGTVLTDDDYEITGNQASAAGSYVMTVEGKNNYTGKAKKTYVLLPVADQMVSDGKGDVKIGEGTIKVVVSAGQDVPGISLVSDKKELIETLVRTGSLTADEITLIAEGGTIELTLKVERAEASVSLDIKAAMEKAASGFTIGQYLNITLTKQVNGGMVTEIHEISAPIKISFRLGSDLLNTDSKVKREYMVLRNHEGEVTSLAGTFADGIITFETDRFSDYAIAWKDTAVAAAASKKHNSDGLKRKGAKATPAGSKLARSRKVPTGDTAPIEWMLFLAALSAAGIGLVFARRRRR